MAKRFDSWVFARSCVLASLWMAAAGATAATPSSSSASPVAYEARAHVVDVVRAFLGPRSVPAPGAGVRVFRDPDAVTGGTERFEIRWYANPPGIPPGAVVLLETVQERSPAVKNHVVRTDGKSEGHVRSVIEIPPQEIRRAGRVVKWRARVIWRGKLLDSRASENWNG